MTEESLVLGYLTDPTWRVLEVGPGGHPTPWPGAYESVDLTAPGERGAAGSEQGVVCTATHRAHMAKLPFGDETFDALVARHVLEHTPDTLTVLREWRRVLRPKGLLLVVCPDQATYPGNTTWMDPTHWAAFTRQQLAALVAHAGFADVDYETAQDKWSFLVRAAAA